MANSYTHTPRNSKTHLTIPISLVLLASLVLGTSLVYAQSPDFALTATPSNLCVNPGVDAVAAISLQSVNGFAGTVNLGATIDPNTSDGATVSPIPSTETLSAGQTASFDLSLTTTTATPLRTYYITVSGFSAGILHQATVQLTVAAGCSVGGLVVQSAGLAPVSSYIVYGLVVAGMVGLVGATLVVWVSRRKPLTSP